MLYTIWYQSKNNIVLRVLVRVRGCPGVPDFTMKKIGNFVPNSCPSCITNTLPKLNMSRFKCFRRYQYLGRLFRGIAIIFIHKFSFVVDHIC
jgi:hypothetical protein